MFRYWLRKIYNWKLCCKLMKMNNKATRLTGGFDCIKNHATIAWFFKA